MKEVKNTVDNFQNNMTKLKTAWEEAKTDNQNLTKEVIDLDAFFALYENEKNNIDDSVKVDLVAYLCEVITLIKENNEKKNKDKILKETFEGVTFNNISLKGELLLMKGAKVVKGLNKGNPVSSRANTSRAKKYLAGGIILTILGGALLAGLAVCAILAAPGLAATVPVLAPIAHTAHAILTWAGITYGGLNAISLFSADLMAIAFTFLSPVLPLVGGIWMLKKALKLPKAPTGLALALANTLPALAEKVHYGDEKETEVAKLAKAEGKLLAFQELSQKQNGGSTQNPDTAYINAGVAYYKARVKHLKKKSEKPSHVAPSKRALLKAKNAQGVSGEAKAAVSVNDHRKNANGLALEGATLKLSDSLKGTLFAKHYHVKHAMKVEEAVREVRRQATVARGG